MLEVNKIYNEDCLVGMNRIPDKSIDMILCDLPYGTTSCKWDTILPFKKLWEQYIRVIKDNGAIVLTSAQPFTTSLINSNLIWFKYTWYWIKNAPTGFSFAKYQPMRNVEDICVFYKKMPTYNPQGLIKLEEPIKRSRRKGNQGGVYKPEGLTGKEYKTTHKNYPKQTLNIKVERGLHPTQKPTELFEYLIKSYTEEGEIVLDNCLGSGTTAIAALKTNRKFIGFELDKEYYEIASKRIEEHYKGLNNNG
ncbi:DNA-methyltransferase [Gottfriedia sp. NPDC056225]|uniref:DNA-methyltransferase n=1 Tax=Gottfriedia sp. NPDC056225 TaxID=3345751 RepID=UPI0035E3AB27